MHCKVEKIVVVNRKKINATRDLDLINQKIIYSIYNTSTKCTNDLNWDGCTDVIGAYTDATIGTIIS